MCSSEPLRRKPELLSLLMALTTYSSHLRGYSCRKDYYTSQFALVPFLTMKSLTGFPLLLSPSANGNASSTLPKVGVCFNHGNYPPSSSLLPGQTSANQSGPLPQPFHPSPLLLPIHLPTRSQNDLSRMQSCFPSYNSDSCGP